MRRALAAVVLVAGHILSVVLVLAFLWLMAAGFLVVFGGWLLGSSGALVGALVLLLVMRVPPFVDLSARFLRPAVAVLDRPWVRLARWIDDA